MRPALILVCSALAGCAAANNSQLTACQAEKEQLLATIRSQRETNRALSQQAASLESRLDEAERALAQGPSAPRLSKSAEPPSAVTKAASLSWRNPHSPGTGEAGQRPAELKLLASQDRRLKYDARTDTAKMDLALAFREGTATLSADDKLQLDDVARLLKAPAVRELGVVVSAAEAERAKAVVDYLDSHGVAHQRLAVHTARGSGTNQVQLELQAPRAPVAGRGASTRSR